MIAFLFFLNFLFHIEIITFIWMPNMTQLYLWKWVNFLKLCNALQCGVCYEMESHYFNIQLTCMKTITLTDSEFELARDIHLSRIYPDSQLAIGSRGVGISKDSLWVGSILKILWNIKAWDYNKHVAWSAMMADYVDSLFWYFHFLSADHSQVFLSCLNWQSYAYITFQSSLIFGQTKICSYLLAIVHVLLNICDILDIIKDV